MGTEAFWVPVAAAVASTVVGSMIGRRSELSSAPAVASPPPLPPVEPPPPPPPPVPVMPEATPTAAKPTATTAPDALVAAAPAAAAAAAPVVPVTPPEVVKQIDRQAAIAPGAAAFDTANFASAQKGPSSTSLTGIGGIDPSLLKLGKSTLLGA